MTQPPDDTTPDGTDTPAGGRPDDAPGVGSPEKDPADWVTGDAVYEEAALGHLILLHELGPKHPTAFGHLLRAIDFHLNPVREVALVGDDVTPLARVVREQLRPRLVLAAGPAGSSPVPLLADRTAIDGRATAYVCERFACRQPVNDPGELRQVLG